MAGAGPTASQAVSWPERAAAPTGRPSLTNSPSAHQLPVPAGGAPRAKTTQVGRKARGGRPPLPSRTRPSGRRGLPNWRLEAAQARAPARRVRLVHSPPARLLLLAVTGRGHRLACRCRLPRLPARRRRNWVAGHKVPRLTEPRALCPRQGRHAMTHACYCVTTHNAPLERMDCPTPEPKGAEVLIRMTAAGVLSQRHSHLGGGL